MAINELKSLNKIEQQANLGSSKASTKTEGTSRTWGQLIFRNFKTISNVNSATTTDYKQGSLIYESIASSKFDSEQLQGSPNDTLVKIVRNSKDVQNNINSQGSVFDFSCRALSNISTAAASSNKEATVILPSNVFTTPQPQMLFGKLLTSFATAVPNVVEFAVVAGSSVKSKQEQKDMLLEAEKVDSVLAMHSQQSDPLEFNTLTVPDLETKLVYNFYTDDEEDILSQEDQSQDPLIKNKPYDVPRFVELKWPSTDVIEETKILQPTSDIQKQPKRKSKNKSSGVFGTTSRNFQNSVDKNKKQIMPIIRDGQTREVVDIHNIEKGFEAIVNDKVFNGTTQTVFNISETNGSIGTIPVKGVLKHGGT